MKTIYLSLGSNQGDREQNLQEAVDRIHEAGVRLVRCSSVFETKAMYLERQPQFLNLVLEGETSILPRTLLKRLQLIERDMGRQRLVQNGPRPIDIDILFYGRFIVDAPELTIPHFKLAERRFVLEPLVELASDLRHPVTKSRMRELLAALPPQGVRRVPFRIALPLDTNSAAESTDSPRRAES